MGIAKQPFSSKVHHQSLISNFDNSMSQDYHHQHQHPGIFSFVPNGFERSQQEQHEEHIAQQIRRDKLRVLQGFEATQMNPLVALGATESEGYNESGGMLSEMFNFSPGGTTATELLENQISQSYRNSRPTNMNGVGIDWYGQQRQHELPVGGLGPLVDIKNPPHHHHQISSINTNSAASMQLFLMNPPPPHRSPSPSGSSHPPPPPPVTSSSSTLHMLLPNPSSNTTLQGYHNHQNGGPPFEPPQFSNWVADTHNEARLNNPNEIGGVEGLSLSLSSSLQNFEGANKGDNGMVFFDQGAGSTSHEQFTFKNLGGHNNQQQIHVGYGSSLGIVNVLRNSKYGKAAQDLLEEFCSVGRGQIKKSRNPNSNNQTGTNGTCSSSSKEHHSLSASDRLEHQRRKLKLLSMLDEVEKRYNNYCEQMQMVVNSFDLVMGFGAALPYTALAQKAMSRHFRCLKDAITSQLKNSCEVLGEKDIAGTSGGLTKGETPRLKLLEQSLRQQRTFHQMGGMMEQEAWRPQRGLPERSVNILRAWLFEHFLHPYPSDADKHVLARQTGLSRNQVSNWFINARVRLWKPMVEEMYQQESKEGEETEETEERELIVNNKQQEAAQTSTPNANAGNVKTITAATADVTATTTEAIRATTGKTIENDPSLLIAINTRCVSENQAKKHSVINAESIMNATTTTSTSLAPPVMQPYSGNDDIGSTFIRFGTSSGDVSLTLGLRHTGNMPEKNSFSVRDFESF